ncbi:tetratricopeptide repeat protein [Daejeonella sp. H1SJ63]|uniref:tetratricopeptide repeat protein n=1 Tax=Daejeonella sp. H1SJ63 TaxID=3034145 RepID=UPI0023EBCE97|nr:tetratricopeptide repeat protein [Daejeonella sp. H1SJ63]
MKKTLLFLFIVMTSLSTKAQLSTEEALAVQYYQTGDFEKAAVIYEKLFNSTKNLSFYDPYFNSLLKTRQYNEAEKLARTQMKSHPEVFTYSVDIGRVYLEKGEESKSSEWFNNLIRNLPANEFAVKDLAITFYRAEAYDFSIKTLITGRKLVNNENAFIYDLLSLYRFRKDKTMLIQEYILLLGINPQTLQQAQNVLGGILEDRNDYDILKSAILRKLQKDPQNVVMTEFLTWQYVQQKDFDMAVRQSLALDRRLKEDGGRIYELSRLLIANQAYEQAIEVLNYLKAKGQQGRYYIPARVDLLNVRAQQLKSVKLSKPDLEKLEGDYLSLLNEFGRNAGTTFAIRQLAKLQAYYLNKPKEAAEQLQKLIELNGIPPLVIGEAKTELADIYLISEEMWEAALLYSQVEKAFTNDILGQEARFKNAKLAYFQGDFTWSKAQLDVLKSSTSQLIANDALDLSLLISDNLQNETDTAALIKYAKADLFILKNESEAAIKSLDSLHIIFPNNSLADDVLMAKARIFIKNNELQKAVAELQEILDNYSTELWGDDAIFMLADIYETRLEQPEKARELFQKIISDYPGSIFVIEARKRFRQLRGDKLG